MAAHVSVWHINPISTNFAHTTSGDRKFSQERRRLSLKFPGDAARVAECAMLTALRNTTQLLLRAGMVCRPEDEREVRRMVMLYESLQAVPEEERLDERHCLSVSGPSTSTLRVSRAGGPFGDLAPGRLVLVSSRRASSLTSIYHAFIMHPTRLGRRSSRGGRCRRPRRQSAAPRPSDIASAPTGASR